MSRLDHPGQVALMFAGAALVSLLLVALLTAEAKTRKALKAEPTIENTNIFSSVGRSVSRFFSRHHVSTADEPNHHRISRDLKSIVVARPEQLNSSNDVTTMWRVQPSSHHRHHHNGERHHIPHHRTPHPTAGSGAANITGTPEQSETCYGPNEVLLIIAITCAVNFAFIFGVMAIVHLCNVRGRRAAHEALSSIVSVGHVDTLQGECKHLLRRSSCSLDSSLPGSMSLLLMPDLEDATLQSNMARHAWQHSNWRKPPPPPRCRLSSTQYQPLLAHSMEDLHILE